MNPAWASSLDAFPLPGPVWLLRLLLLLCFFAHVVFMNLMAGGAFLAAVYALKGKPKHLWVAGRLARMLPYATPLAILMGVGAFLFAQILYGPLVYSAGVLMGAPLILVIPVLILAYSLMYFTSWQWERLGRARGYALAAIVLLLGYVGFAFANWFSLVLEPDRFLAKHLAHPGGWQLDLADFTVLPRFLHTLLAMVAVAGLWVAWGGMRRLRLEPEEGRWQFRSGATWFSGATIVNMVVGAWWLMALPQEPRKALSGGDLAGTASLLVGFAGGVTAIVLVLRGINSIRPARLVNGAIHALLISLLAMAVTRDAVRGAYLREAFSLDRLPVRTQWGALLLFLAVLAAGSCTVYWLARLARRSRGPRPGEEPPVQGPGLTDSGLRRILPTEQGFTRQSPTDSGPGRAAPGAAPQRLDDE